MMSASDEVMQAMSALRIAVDYVARHAHNMDTYDIVDRAMKAGFLVQEELTKLSQKVHDAERAAADERDKFKAGDRVWYQDKRGEMERMVPGVIVSVHQDGAGGPPYYDVSLTDGSVPQTIMSRLHARSS